MLISRKDKSASAAEARRYTTRTLTRDATAPLDFCLKLLGNYLKNRKKTLESSKRLPFMIISKKGESASAAGACRYTTLNVFFSKH